MILICLSLIIIDAGHLFICLLANMCIIFGEMLIHVCRKKRISYEGLTITPETTRAGAVNKISCIHLHMLFEDINSSDEQIDKVITLALKHCSMVQSVEGSIDITFSHARI